jgi:hypothetical protein
VLCIVLCFALGIANIFSFNALRIVFSVICLYVVRPYPDPAAMMS